MLRGNYNKLCSLCQQEITSRPKLFAKKEKSLCTWCVKWKGKIGDFSLPFHTPCTKGFLFIFPQSDQATWQRQLSSRSGGWHPGPRPSLHESIRKTGYGRASADRSGRSGWGQRQVGSHLRRAKRGA